MSFKVKPSSLGFKVMNEGMFAYEVTSGPYGASAIITDAKGRFCTVPLDGSGFVPHHTFPMPEQAIDAVNRGLTAWREGRLLDEANMESEIVDFGRAGDTCSWSLDKNGTLTISGRGPMYDFVDGGEPEYVKLHPYEIERVVVENGITKIGSLSFANLPIKEAQIGFGVSEIGTSAFACCHGLDSIVVPSNVEKIGSNAFYNSGLSNVLLCEGVKEVSSGAFAHCSELNEIRLPLSTEKVGDYAFAHTEAAIHTFRPDIIPDSAVWGEKGSPVIDENRDWDESDYTDDIGDPGDYE